MNCFFKEGKEREFHAGQNKRNRDRERERENYMLFQKLEQKDLHSHV